MTTLTRRAGPLVSRRAVAIALPAWAIGLSRLARAEETSIVLRRPDGASVPALALGTPVSGAPVAVFSHGLGADGRALLWLAEAFRERGFVCVLPSHPESGRAAVPGMLQRIFSGARVWRAVAQVVADPRLEIARSEDVAAALAWAEAGKPAPFRVLIGHSMGAATALIEAGAKTTFGGIGHDAFDAYIAISPAGPGDLFPPDAWSEIAKPVLIVTGTRDKGAGGGWEWRASTYYGLHRAFRRLAVIAGAGHLQLGGWAGPALRSRLIALAEEFVDQARAKAFAPSRVAGVDVKED